MAANILGSNFQMFDFGKSARTVDSSRQELFIYTLFIDFGRAWDFSIALQKSLSDFGCPVL